MLALNANLLPAAKRTGQWMQSVGVGGGTILNYRRTLAPIDLKTNLDG